MMVDELALYDMTPDADTPVATTMGVWSHATAWAKAAH